MIVKLQQAKIVFGNLEVVVEDIETLDIKTMDIVEPSVLDTFYCIADNDSTKPKDILVIK